jgi:thermostable 8-oxoguanine DNA glycosylase
MEQMYKMPAKMKDGDWRDLIDTLLNDATRISVPDELTYKGLFMELVETFCTLRISAHSAEELLTGKPWTEDGLTYFKLSALQEYLKRCGFTFYTRGQITERLKEMNDGIEADKTYRFKDNQDRWKSVRVWFVPEMNRGEVDLPEVTFEPEDPPF